MKYIKKYRKIIVAVIVIILIVVFTKGLKAFFDTSGDQDAYYGQRLEGIEKVKITKDQKNKIKALLQEKTSSQEVRIQGRTVEILFVIKPELTRDDAKNMANEILNVFTEEQKKYYDIQVMIDKENAKEFPIIGYKQHTREGYSWTKDR